MKPRRPGLRTDLLVVVFGAVLAAAAWANVEHHLRVDRAAEIGRVHRENDALARAFEEHVRRVLRAADDLLLELEREFETAGGLTPRMAARVERARLDPSVNQVAVADAAGNVVLSAVPLAQPINVGGQESFRVHAGRADAGLFVSPPLRTQVAGTWSFLLSRRLDGPGGAFAGAVAVGLDPAYFSDFYEGLDLGPDRGVMLLGRDGIVRARRFQRQTELGQDLRKSPMFALVPREPAGHYEVTGAIDNQRRFVSYRALPDYPFVVAVSDLTSSALAPYERRRAEERRAAALFTVLVAVFCAAMIAAGRRERRQAERLAAELAERRRAEELVRTAGAIGERTGEEYFREVVAFLARELDAAYALVGELVPGTQRIATRALQAGGAAAPNFEYELDGTPCEEVVGRSPCYFPRGVQERFPRDAMLVEMGVLAYAGLPLAGAGGEALGHIAVCGTREFVDAERDRIFDVLRLFAARSAAEIERLRAETALREAGERYRDLFENASDAIFILDDRQRYADLNRRALELFGYAREEMLGRPVTDFVPAEQVPRSAAAFRELVESGAYRGFEGRMRAKDGRWLDIEVSSSAIVRDGAFAGSRDIVRDVTERRLLEAERLKTQKLESIGTLAGGIAHDFNNLLQGIFGYIAMAKLAAGEPGRSIAMIEQAERALHQAVGLTAQLLAFSKGGKPVRVPVALGDVVEGAARLALSGSRAQCRLGVAPGLWAVDADAGQIAQVVQNIAMNADQAMPGGGTVEVTARNVEPDDPALPEELAGRRCVEIAVRDEGVGIPPENLGRIFDPWFTTKERGSGLGLATSYAIVRNHDGRIVVRSAPGRGSTFLVYLPAAAAEPPAPAPPAPPRGVRPGRVLVMDDEEVVRAVTGELLGVLGHEAAFAAHGEEAVEAYRAAREAGRPFDAVVLDLTIRGGMGGVETVERLRGIDPGVRAVASSGYSDDAALPDYRAHGFGAYLKKPYSLADLRRTLDAVLR